MKKRLLPLLIAFAFSPAAMAQTDEYSLELVKAFLPEGQNFDLSFLTNGTDAGPGMYVADIHVNNRLVNTMRVEMRLTDKGLEPVFTARDMLSFPLKDDVLADFAKMPGGKEVFPLSDYLKDSRVEFDPLHSTMEVSIPQIFTKPPELDGDVAPKALWDYGVNGLVLDYNATGYISKSREHDMESRNAYVNMNARLNLEAWRVHASSTYSHAKQTGSDAFGGGETNDFDIWNVYAQRDIPMIDGTLSLGELSSSGEIFDSFPYRGLRIASNEMMLPKKERQFSPVIRGVANSDAQILIRQNGHVVHTLNVAAGPFELDNLPVFSNQGDLEVIIRESNGNERVMIVPYSSVPEMLYAGSYRYDLNIGQYYRRKMSSSLEKIPVVMATGKRGFSNYFTGYGGILLSDGYFSNALGAAVSLGTYGALAGDVTYSHATASRLNLDEDADGFAWRLRYEKTMLDTGTTINIMNYRYLTGDYRSFSQVAGIERGLMIPNYSQYSERDRFQASVTQNLQSFGSLTARYTQTNYRNDTDTHSWGLNYSRNFFGMTANLDFTRDYHRTYSQGMKAEERYMLTLSIPFSLLLNETAPISLRNTSADYSLTSTRHADGSKSHDQQVTVRGNSEDTKFSWSMTQTLGHKEDRDTNFRLAYNADKFGADIGYGHNSWSNSYRAGLNGAFVVHSGGVTATRHVNDSIAIVSVPGVSGVRLFNGIDNTTDMFGNTVLPYLNNYTRNEISLDAGTLPNGVILLNQGSQVVYPTQGSIMKVVFPARVGMDALFYLKNDGTPVPFGAQVALKNEDGTLDQIATGFVGEEGRVYLSGLPKEGELAVNVTNNETVEQLNYPYSIPEKDDEDLAQLWLDITPGK